MIRCKLKEKVGFHIRYEPRKGRVKYLPGDIIEVENIKELGGAADKFEILDPVPKENPIELNEPATMLKMMHRGGGRYNVVNIETDEAVNNEYLTKKEAEEMVGLNQVEEETKSRRRRK
jgi:hypothetical protein